MANVKISQLPTATTLTAADLLPIVQGGVTKQVTPDLLPVSTATATALAGKDAAGAATAAQAAAVQRANHTGTQSADTITDGTTNKAYTATERTKLAGIATGATANRTDAATDTLLAAKADLVAGVIPTSQIPAIALTNAVTVASQAAMLALTTTQVQPGDVAVRTDGAGTFILTATDPTVLGNWVRLNAPTDAVTTVNGQSGTVVLTAANVGADAAGAAAAITPTSLGLGNVTNTSDANKPVSTAQSTAIANSTINLPVNVMSANGTAVIGARNAVNASAGPIAVTLPTPTVVGQHIIIERSDTSAVTANAITITGTIRGVGGTVVTLAAVGAANEGGHYVSESLTSWAIAGSIKPKAVLDLLYGSVANQTALLAAAGYTGTVRGAWAGNTAYAIGDVVAADGGLVRAVTAHTSNAAGFTYDRANWEAIPLPILHGASSVRVRHLDLTNAGATGTTVPSAGLFQQRSKRFNYKAERVLWSVQQASDITVTGGTVATGTKPLGSALITCNTTGTMNATLPTRAAFDVTGGFFRVPLTLNDPTNRYFELQISSDGAWTNYHSAALLYSNNDAVPGNSKVVMYGIPVAEMVATGTGATLTAITAARIQNSNGAPALTMEVEQIRWHPNASDKAKVVLWFDDGGLGNQVAAMKVLAKYGFPVTIAAIANNLTGSASTFNGDAARHMQNVYGAQIAIHAYGGNDHNISQQTGNPILEQLLDYQHFELAMGFNGGDDLAYWNPGLTQATPLSDEVTIRKLFRSARTTAGRFPETLPPIDPYRTNASTGSTSAAMQAIVTRAIAYKGCAQFVWHALSAQNLTDLTTFAAWLDTQRTSVDVVTAAGAFDPLCY